MKQILQKLRLIGLIVVVSGLNYGVMSAITTVNADDTDTVYACVDDTTGAARIVSENDTCPEGEHSSEWPKIQAAAPGTLSDVEVVWSTASRYEGNWDWEASSGINVNCPDGKVAIGGGVSATPGAWLSESHPIGEDITTPDFDTSGFANSATGWRVAGINTVVDGPLTAYAICAKVN